jgi:PAS domain S-box-containing protein
MALIFVVDEKNKFVSANKATREFLECRHKDLIGKPINDFIVPESSPEGDKYPRLSGSTTNREIKFRVNGRTKTLLMHAIPVLVDGKRLLYGIGQDITERKRMEEALKESEERFRQLYLSMRENVALHRILYDSGGKAVDYIFADLNPAFEKTIGLRKADVAGKKGFEVFKMKTSPYVDVFAKVVKTGKPAYFEAEVPFYSSKIYLSVFSLGKDEFAVVFNPIE